MYEKKTFILYCDKLDGGDCRIYIIYKIQLYQFDFYVKNTS